MDPEYYNHYLQLVWGILLLNQSSISPKSIEISNSLLTAFVSKCQVLYAPRYMSFNVHYLLHLPDVVRDLGPLWTTSCFPFEDLLGRMLNCVHGTRYVGLQIFNKVASEIIIANKLHRLPEESHIKTYCQELRISSKRVKSAQRISEHIFTRGKIQRLNKLPDNIRIALINSGIELEPQMSVFKFQRLKKMTQLFYSRNDRTISLDSYCIAINTAEGIAIGFIDTFIRICNCRSSKCVIDCNNAKYYVLLKKLRVTTPFQVSTSMLQFHISMN